MNSKLSLLYYLSGHLPRRFHRTLRTSVNRFLSVGMRNQNHARPRYLSVNPVVYRSHGNYKVFHLSITNQSIRTNHFHDVPNSIRVQPIVPHPDQLTLRRHVRRQLRRILTPHNLRGYRNFIQALVRYHVARSSTRTV